MAAESKGFLRLVSDEGSVTEGEFVSAEAKRHFPDPYLAPWLRACRKLDQAGYGASVVRSYIDFSPRVAELVGPERGFALADTVSSVAIKAGLPAAEMLPSAAAKAAERLNGDEARFRSWMGLMERFANLAPESVLPVLVQMDRLLAKLNLSRLDSWIMAGVRAAGTDSQRRHDYFSFFDPEAERQLERESAEVVYADLARELKLYLNALWGIRAPQREPPASAPDHVRRRSGFSSGIIRIPTSYPGFRGDRTRDLYYAGLAHIGAHMQFSGPPFPIGKLKPVQVAVVSLIEDARVEQLAMRAFPGLRRLWIPFHIAQSTGLMTAPSLLARLSHALIDPDFTDVDGWVKKGRDMFFAAEQHWENPDLSRDIGNLLGNDIGQMRIQFNPRTYVVEPPYRDDNLGLWDFGEDVPPEVMEAEQLFDAVRIEEQQDETQQPDRERQEHETSDDEEANRVNMEVAEEEGIAVARYPEYDYVNGRERPEWTTLVEYRPDAGPAFDIEDLLERYAHVVSRIRALITSARVSRPVRLRGLQEGEFLDVDSAINATISRRIGESPDARIYGRFERRFRDLSVYVLLDVSESTNDKVLGSNETVLDLERAATALLSHAMAELGDPFAVGAFSSNRRDDVRFYRIKDFGTPYGEAARSYLSGLKGGYSTRIGAAMRHAAQDLKKQQTHRKLLLVITDGEPSDIDVPDKSYLVEDARRVVHALAMDGIDVFCVGLDSGGDSYLTRIFGRRNVTQIDNIERFPEKLPMLYLRLTT